MLAASLRQLDFATGDGELISGLVPVGEGLKSSARLDEYVAIRDAAAIREVDYIFFRRFSDGRSSQVAAYVVDNQSERLSRDNLAELHKRVWLHGGVPLIYVAWPTRIDILSCARGPDFWHGDGCVYNPAEHIDLAALIDSALNTNNQRFSAWRLVDGTFWDDPRNARLAKSEARAHEALIAAVVEADEALDGDNHPLLRRLLLLTVLIKYLEDRHVFPNGWFGGFCPGAKSFLEALRSGAPEEIIRLLKNLERRFNGDMFTLSETTQASMTKKVLRQFATLVEAKTLRAQRYLWEQFSFEHIPVEIVSHLYQRFVKGGHGTVYTPPFLVSLLLDYAMPYESMTGKERILDPACGSGVFLVGAFRRLVSVWQSQNSWKTPDVATLKAILRTSIFGVELDTGAIDLAAFSLALAVCDALKPDVIWRDLKFDPLRNTNLAECDFFLELLDSRTNESVLCNDSFDIIVGNPPFESNLTDPGRTLNQELKSERGDLPDKQAAYLFLEQSIQRLKPTGRLCLVQPSGILYNRKAFAFRTRLFTQSAVECVLDFTSIRNLYAPADPKTVAIVVLGNTPDAEHRITHLTFRRTFGARQRIVFEIDHYDRHRISQDAAIQDSFVWRLNLLGGGRLTTLSRRFRSLDTLEAFVEAEGLTYGEGFIVGNRNNRASFLTGMQYLPPDALTSGGIAADKLEVVRETHFEGPRTEELYQSPLMVIRKNETLPFGFWKAGPLAFTSTIVGIGIGRSKLATLQAVFKQFKDRHRTYRLSCVLHGSKAFVAKATAILKQDIDALPFPKDAADLDISFWEEAIQDDVLDYMCDFVRRGQNSELLQSMPTKKQMEDYSHMLCRMLGSVYDNLNAGEAVFLDGLICQPFYFGKETDSAAIQNVDTEKLRGIVYTAPGLELSHSQDTG